MRSVRDSMPGSTVYPLGWTHTSIATQLMTLALRTRPDRVALRAHHCGEVRSVARFADAASTA